MDAYAKAYGESRSGFLARAALEAMADLVPAGSRLPMAKTRATMWQAPLRYPNPQKTRPGIPERAWALPCPAA